MVRLPRGRRGYSLTEMMLVVAITGVLFTIAPSLLIQTNRFFIFSRAKTELQQEARAAMYVMQRRLRQADSDSITIDRATNQPYCSRITFTTAQGATYTYFQSGKELRETVGTRTKTLTKNVKYVSFNFPRTDDLTIVSVSMTLEKDIYEARTKSLHMASEKVRIMN